jgi:hypothetical protein
MTLGMFEDSVTFKESAFIDLYQTTSPRETITTALELTADRKMLT